MISAILANIALCFMCAAVTLVAVVAIKWAVGIAHTLWRDGDRITALFIVAGILLGIAAALGPPAAILRYLGV